MKYNIYGSCVSRDIFSELNLDEHIEQYQARCSLHSKVSEPLKDEEMPELVGIDSNWQKRMVSHDLKKSGLILTSEDILIVDFIDERFNIMQHGETMMTQSKEFNDMGISEQLGCTQAFTRGTEQEFELWREACLKFKNSLAESTPRIILHKGIFALKYPQNGGYSELPKRKMNLEMNRRLEQYYSIFDHILNPIAVIEAPPELIIAEANHKWGLAPFHYIHEYYENIWQQLSSLDL